MYVAVRMTALVIALLLTTATTASAESIATPADRLARIIEHPTTATASRYAARDDAGASLDGLKVIQSRGTYLGVYHAFAGDQPRVYLATSRDLLHWSRRARLDTDASQATIAALPDGGYVVAYEWANTLDVLPREIPGVPLLGRLTTGLQRLVARLPHVRLRFRYYPSLSSLLRGRATRTVTARRSLAKTAEGTPSISGVSYSPDLDHSRIEVGFHYFADLNGDGFPSADRQAIGVLSGFKTWATRPAPALDNALATLSDLHPGFRSPPRGNFGDRDPVVFEGEQLQVQEAQYRRDFSSWRTFLLDPVTLQARALRIVTAGRSRSFGNPTVTSLTAPDGRQAILVTTFLFSEGAAPGEAGSLIYYKELGRGG